MKNTVFALMLLGLGACSMPVNSYVPAVSQYNGDSVTIQVDGTAGFLGESEKNALKAKMQLKADEICRRGHAKRAEFTSQTSRSTGQYSSIIERLYLCLK